MRTTHRYYIRTLTMLRLSLGYPCTVRNLDTNKGWSLFCRDISFRAFHCHDLVMDSVAYWLPRVALTVCVVGLLCVYVIYYLVFNVVRPRVVCRDSHKLRALQTHIPALFKPYWPTAWALSGHVSSIVRLVSQTSPRLHQPRR